MSAEEQDRAEAYEAIDAAFATFERKFGTVDQSDHLTDDIMDALAPVIANIRREAAAAALKAQASRLDTVSNKHLTTAKEHPFTSKAQRLYATYSTQARIDARQLRVAAELIIESGWEHTCATTFPATREDPGYGCENPVEHEGDHCARHDEGDDQ